MNAAEFKGFVDQLQELEAMEKKEIDALSIEIDALEKLQRQLEHEVDTMEQTQMKHAAVARDNMEKRHKILESNRSIKEMKSELRAELDTKKQLVMQQQELQQIALSEGKSYELKIKEMEAHKQSLVQYYTNKLTARQKAAMPAVPAVEQPRNKVNPSLLSKSKQTIQLTATANWQTGRQQMDTTIQKLDAENSRFRDMAKELEGEIQALTSEIASTELKLQSVMEILFSE